MLRSFHSIGYKIWQNFQTSRTAICESAIAFVSSGGTPTLKHSKLCFLYCFMILGKSVWDFIPFVAQEWKRPEKHVYL